MQITRKGYTFDMNNVTFWWQVGETFRNGTHYECSIYGMDPDNFILDEATIVHSKKGYEVTFSGEFFTPEEIMDSFLKEKESLEKEALKQMDF